MSLEELKEIARNNPSPMVVRLLLEIRRLRVVEARAGDVLRNLDPHMLDSKQTLKLLAGALRDAIEGKMPAPEK